LSKDTKFPQALREYSGKKAMTIYLFEESGTDAYAKEMVQRWLKRCVEDSPILETKYGLWEEWYSKWFNQFETSQTEEQKDV